MKQCFLIADDSVPKTYFLETMIKKLEFPADIIIARTTHDARKIIDERTIDFAFVDYEMPTENGPSVIRYLRTKRPEAKIALVTAHGIEKYHEEADEAGADAFICTTYAQADVVRAISDVLDEWRIASGKVA